MFDSLHLVRLNHLDLLRQQTDLLRPPRLGEVLVPEPVVDPREALPRPEVFLQLQLAGKAVKVGQEEPEERALLLGCKPNRVSIQYCTGWPLPLKLIV